MNRLNRRRFLALGAASTASVVLVACGNKTPSEEELNPTQVPDVAGAPPTLAPITSTPQAAAGGGETTGNAGGAAAALTITAMDSLSFDPSEADVSPGQTITLKNDGFLQHDIAVDEWGGELTPLLNNGETADFTIPEDAAVGDTFEYFCTVPGHKEGGMVGTFTIVEAGAAAPAGEEATAEEGAAAGGAAEALTIKAMDSLSFDPAEASVSPGQVVTLQNDGFLQHDIAVDEWGGELTPLLNNGETADFTIPEDAAVGDTFEYYCTVPGHKEGGMVGTFTIVEAAAGGAAPAAEGTAEEAPAEEATAGGTTDGAAGGESAATAVEVVATDLAFDQSEITIAADTDVTVTLKNEGQLQHDFAVEDTDFATELLNGGDSGDVVINLPEGDYVFYCTVAGHRQAGMEGTLKVVAGGGGAAAPAGESTAAAGEGTAAAGGEAATAVEVVATDLAFDQSEITIAADTDVTVTLHNEGQLQHDFVVEDTDFATDLLDGGTSGDVVINLPEGDYTFFCSVAGHRQAGMEGTLKVVAGGGEVAGAAPAAGAAESTPAATAGDASDPAAVTVNATEWEFSPSDFEVVPGGTITLVNNGTVAHGMSAEAFGGNFLGPVGSGQSAEFTVPDDVQPGDTIEYTAINSSASELGMGGTITIVEGEAGGSASPAASPEAAATGGSGSSGPITILAMDSLSFDPSEVEVAPGQTVILKNDGFLQHDLAVDEWGGPMTELLNNAETGEFTIPDDVQDGEQYIFYCTVAGHRQGGMEGTFTIVGGGAATASPAASPVASPVASPAASGSAGGGSDAVEIVATDIAFDKEELTIAADTDVTVTLVNDGFLEHDFVVEDTDFATELAKAQESVEVVVNLPAGEYTYFCSVAGHRQAGMEGTLIVE